MKRKSPYRHPVRSHTRSGIHVGKYERGKGSKPKPRRRDPSTGKKFTVIAHFGRGRESLPVRANTYSTALREGLGMIQTPEIPDRIMIRRI